MDTQLFQPGAFFVGCNYWASHAGMRMWSEWDEQVVHDDLRRLSQAKISALRVFTLWSDFQPLRMHYSGEGQPKQIRMGEAPLPDTPAGRAGVDERMLERFERFCDLANQYGLRLIVGLITGWMSGRLFVPEMLQGRNVLTDPLALKWEIKFVRLMVSRFKDHPAIAAWDLGNECNCMGPLESAEQAYVWSAAISMAIRMEDRRHPVVSGMHSLSPDGVWRMQDQGELTDILCTHPYPLFVPHCDTDPLNQMKSALHAAAESLYYKGLGGKTCFAEEAGSLGPMMAADELAADYTRAMLFTLLAHDCRGMMWWCANEQSALTLTPYDWHAVERELGLFYLDKTPKPTLCEMTRFSTFLETLPKEGLPTRIVDAVCVLTPGQDCWAAAYGAFILAKQAGLDLEFAWIEDELPEARAYILPSLDGYSPLTRRSHAKLLKKVRLGATLYLSLEGAILSPFAEFTGLRVWTRAHAPAREQLDIQGARLDMESEYTLRLKSVGAQVLSRTQAGDAAFAVNKYGAGRVYTLCFPIEKTMAVRPGMVDSPAAQDYWRIYQAIDIRSADRRARVDLPSVGLTEHVLDENTRFLIAVNYEPFDQTARLTLDAPWRVAECRGLSGQTPIRDGRLCLGRNDGALIRIVRD